MTPTEREKRLRDLLFDIMLQLEDHHAGVYPIQPLTLRARISRVLQKTAPAASKLKPTGDHARDRLVSAAINLRATGE